MIIPLSNVSVLGKRTSAIKLCATPDKKGPGWSFSFKQPDGSVPTDLVNTIFRTLSRALAAPSTSTRASIMYTEAQVEEAKQRLLKRRGSEQLRADYELVKSGELSEPEFWLVHDDVLCRLLAEMQASRRGAATAVAADEAAAAVDSLQDRASPDGIIEITSAFIESVLVREPIIRRALERFVGGGYCSAEEFWTRYLQARRAIARAQEDELKQAAVGASRGADAPHQAGAVSGDVSEDAAWADERAFFSAYVDGKFDEHLAGADAQALRRVQGLDTALLDTASDSLTLPTGASASIDLSRSSRKPSTAGTKRPRAITHTSNAGWGLRAEARHAEGTSIVPTSGHSQAAAVASVEAAHAARSAKQAALYSRRHAQAVLSCGPVSEASLPQASSTLDDGDQALVDLVTPARHTAQPVMLAASRFHAGAGQTGKPSSAPASSTPDIDFGADIAALCDAQLMQSLREADVRSPTTLSVATALAMNASFGQLAQGELSASQASSGPLLSACSEAWGNWVKSTAPKYAQQLAAYWKQSKGFGKTAPDEQFMKLLSNLANHYNHLLGRRTTYTKKLPQSRKNPVALRSMTASVRVIDALLAPLGKAVAHAQGKGWLSSQ